MSNPDYFSNFNPKSFLNEHYEKEEEPLKINLFKPENLKKDFILD